MARPRLFGKKKQRQPKDSEGERARREAEENLLRARSHREEVERISGSLRQQRNDNHFVDRITEMIRGGV